MLHTYSIHVNQKKNEKILIYFRFEMKDIVNDCIKGQNKVEEQKQQQERQQKLSVLSNFYT